MSEQTNTDMGKHFYRASAADFMKIPGSPVAYWTPNSILNAFVQGERLEDVAPTRKGMVTAQNSEYVRYWFEVSESRSGYDRFQSRDEAKSSGKKWFSYLKGGGYRRWYGNKLDVVNWENDGHLLQTRKHPSENRVWATNFNLDYIFQPNINWGAVTSSHFSARFSSGGELFDAGGSACFPSSSQKSLEIVSFLNSSVSAYLLQVLNPTLNFQAGNIADLPTLSSNLGEKVKLLTKRCIEIAKRDWDTFEYSWDFTRNPLVTTIASNTNKLKEVYADFSSACSELSFEQKSLEEEINICFLKAYKLMGVLTYEVNLSDITLNGNYYYRYDIQEDSKGVIERFQCDTLVEMLSYAIGCMMGRYSLDKPGLILASQGETIQDYLAQIPSPKFMPDDDAILPLTDQEWFADDVTNRFREFVKVVWGEETQQENLDFVAESLCLHAIKPKKGETAMETIRRYLSTQFYKDHMKTYKKRPIYWLFSSGKQKAFECLVYLHRYNEGTLSRMRTEYVTPLMGKYESQIRHIEEQQASASAAEKTKLGKELKDYQSKLNELREFDSKLKHYADMRISLDLDDGVKVNYGKFGDLLANVKDITGEKPKLD